MQNTEYNKDYVVLDINKNKIYSEISKILPTKLMLVNKTKQETILQVDINKKIPDSALSYNDFLANFVNVLDETKVMNFDMVIREQDIDCGDIAVLLFGYNDIEKVRDHYEVHADELLGAVNLDSLVGLMDYVTRNALIRFSLFVNDNELMLKVHLLEQQYCGCEGYSNFEVEHITPSYCGQQQEIELPDLSKFITRDEAIILIGDLIKDKADRSELINFVTYDKLDDILKNYYTKDEINDLLKGLKVDLSKYYTKIEVDSLLLNYYNKKEIDSKLKLKADKDSVYTKDIIDTKLEAKADKKDLEFKADKDSVYTKNEVYNKPEIDAKLELKADKESVYTKNIVDAKLDLKADKDSVYNKNEVYNKSETDTKLDSKANKSDLDLKADKNNVYNKSETYNKPEVDELIKNIKMPEIKEVDLSDYYKKDSVYNKDEINKKFAEIPRQKKTDLSNYYTKFETYDKNSVYNKPEVDDLISKIKLDFENLTPAEVDIFHKTFWREKLDAFDDDFNKGSQVIFKRDTPIKIVSPIEGKVSVYDVKHKTKIYYDAPAMNDEIFRIPKGVCWFTNENQVIQFNYLITEFEYEYTLTNFNTSYNKISLENVDISKPILESNNNDLDYIILKFSDRKFIGGLESSYNFITTKQLTFEISMEEASYKIENLTYPKKEKVVYQNGFYMDSFRVGFDGKKPCSLIFNKDRFDVLNSYGGLYVPGSTSSIELTCALGIVKKEIYPKNSQKPNFFMFQNIVGDGPQGDHKKWGQFIELLSKSDNYTFFSAALIEMLSMPYVTEVYHGEATYNESFNLSKIIAQANKLIEETPKNHLDEIIDGCIKYTVSDVGNTPGAEVVAWNNFFKTDVWQKFCNWISIDSSVLEEKIKLFDYRNSFVLNAHHAFIAYFLHLLNPNDSDQQSSGIIVDSFKFNSAKHIKNIRQFKCRPELEEIQRKFFEVIDGHILKTIIYSVVAKNCYKEIKCLTSDYDIFTQTSLLTTNAWRRYEHNIRTAYHSADGRISLLTCTEGRVTMIESPYLAEYITNDFDKSADKSYKDNDYTFTKKLVEILFEKEKSFKVEADGYVYPKIFNVDEIGRVYYVSEVIGSYLQIGDYCINGLKFKILDENSKEVPFIINQAPVYEYDKYANARNDDAGININGGVIDKEPYGDILNLRYNKNDKMLKIVVGKMIKDLLLFKYSAKFNLRSLLGSNHNIRTHKPLPDIYKVKDVDDLIFTNSPTTIYNSSKINDVIFTAPSYMNFNNVIEKHNPLGMSNIMRFVINELIENDSKMDSVNLVNRFTRYIGNDHTCDCTPNKVLLKELEKIEVKPEDNSHYFSSALNFNIKSYLENSSVLERIILEYTGIDIVPNGLDSEHIMRTPKDELKLLRIATHITDIFRRDVKNIIFFTQQYREIASSQIDFPTVRKQTWNRPGWLEKICSETETQLNDFDRECLNLYISEGLDIYEEKVVKIVDNNIPTLNLEDYIKVY